ncbi:MAG TPA: 16S rRNA (cytidine(1402)-2'-O)-methyltransferase [Myxococcaceae bacterium]|nr:16S rRNA (cytidine(1402)-2'-O)-methyltransferase [Myxococcaceae bacterium]
MSSGRLYLVATPIGNLGDLTHRAVETLSRVDFVVCEDTRHSRVLLDHYGLRKQTVSLPAFDEGSRAGPILDRLERGESAALVTDAGSPAVSDPGEALVAQALERGLEVTPIPGPTALVAALSASGLPTARFHFMGFLPRKVSDREAVLAEVAALRASLVLYESPRRLVETLGDLMRALGDRRACVARELTKAHEEFARGTLSSLAEIFGRGEVRGEVAVVVEGRLGEARWVEEEVLAALKQGLARGERLKALSGEIARRSGWKAQDVYRLGLKS